MQFTGERYDGELHKNGSMEGKGKYIFPDGSYYKGEMKDGMFHGQGTMYFKGHGKYKAMWHEGSVVKGEYTFSDGLVYTPESWSYCTPGDRRFFWEVQNGLRPAGESLFANSPTSTSASLPPALSTPSHAIPSVPITPSTASGPSTRPLSSSSSASHSNPSTPKDKIAKRSTPPASPKHR